MSYGQVGLSFDPDPQLFGDLLQGEPDPTVHQQFFGGEAIPFKPQVFGGEPHLEPLPQLQ
ncbi:MAG TPA: hypothetical protein DCZ80_05725 [Legionellales bacterium]|nr:hypothetical protein [Legionellales bacterium]